MLGRKDKETKPKELGETFNMRITDDLRKKIEAKARSEGISLSEAVRTALTDYLHRDVNIYNGILGTLSSLEKDMERLQRQLELHSNLFVYYLRFFFAFEGKEIEGIPKDSRKQFFDKGERRRDDFIKLFKQQNANHVNIFEMMMSDLMTAPNANNDRANGRLMENGMGIGD